MLSKFTFLFLLLSSLKALALDIRIVESRRNIQLSEDEPVYRDFYINAGTDAGLKENTVVKVTRKVTVRDTSGTQTLGEVSVPVGRLRILWAQSNLSIAREYGELKPEDRPVLDQGGFQIGDRIDTKGSFIDQKKTTVKRSTASVTLGTPEKTIERGPAIEQKEAVKEKIELPENKDVTAQEKSSEETRPQEVGNQKETSDSPDLRATGTSLSPAG